MAAAPVNHLSLTATSRAEVLAFHALYDIGQCLCRTSKPEFRLIGGNMVTLHAKRYGLEKKFYRETKDADLGFSKIALKKAEVVGAFSELNYARVRGDRLERSIDERAGKVTIDFLIAETMTRTRQNIAVGPMRVTEAKNLSLALKRPPVLLTLELHVEANTPPLVVHQLPVADEVSALALKVGALNTRNEPKDAEDLWRLGEVLYAARRHIENAQERVLREALEEAATLFETNQSLGTRLLREQKKMWNNDTFQRELTRLRALFSSLQSIP